MLWLLGAFLAYLQMMGMVGCKNHLLPVLKPSSLLSLLWSSVRSLVGHWCSHLSPLTLHESTAVGEWEQGTVFREAADSALEGSSGVKPHSLRLWFTSCLEEWALQRADLTGGGRTYDGTPWGSHARLAAAPSGITKRGVPGVCDCHLPFSPPEHLSRQETILLLENGNDHEDYVIF